MEEKELIFPEEDPLFEVKTKPSTTGMVLLVYGTTGVGKTTIFAQSPSPLIVQVADNSVDFLKNSNQMHKDVPCIVARSWHHLLKILNRLSMGGHNYKTIVIDGISGVEQYCDSYIIENKYKGDTVKFHAYGAGYAPSAFEFQSFVNIINRFRDEACLTVVMLAHQESKTVNNPDGDDYTHYRPQIQKLKLDSLTKPIDGILMIDYHMTIKKNDSSDTKGKVISGGTRIMYTKDKGSIVAKNRLGLKPVIVLGNSHEEAWTNFTRALADAKK